MSCDANGGRARGVPPERGERVEKKQKKGRNNLENRGHAIHTVSAGNHAHYVTPPGLGGGTTRERERERGVEPPREGVKRNIFQQISHVCLIMYIALAAGPKTGAHDCVAIAHAPLHDCRRPKEGGGCILF